MIFNRFSRFQSTRSTTDRAKHAIARSAAKARPMVVEPLEDRQMLSLTVDLRVEGAGNSKVATATSVGQVINLQEWVTITGNSSGSNDGLVSVTGSVLGTKTTSSSVNGNLSAAVSSPYVAYGASDGKQQDLNGDGNLDVGSDDNSQVAGFINARAGYVVQNGTVSGNSQSFVVATMRYTVTSLSSGRATDVNFRFRDGVPAGAYDAVWVQDGNGENDQSGTIGVGSPVVISDSSIVPTTGTISGTVTKSVNGSTSAFGGVTVYLDSNHNGVLNSGEPSVTTDSSGAYSFSNLNAGTYYLREVVPSGYSQTAPSSTPTLITVSGSDSFTQNFTDTAVVAKPGSISGTVYKAASGKTTVGFSGVTVFLDINNDGIFDTGDASATTGSSGSYSFGNLPSGTYHLREVVPAGYKQTSPASTPTNVTLSAGQNAGGQNFTDTSIGTFTPGSISGTVYNDKNGNGKLDSGETGIANVELYLDLNKDGKIDPGDPTTTTNSSGAYTFGGLAPASYRVREVVLSGYKITNPSVGYFDVTILSNYQIKGDNFFNQVTSTSGPITLSGNVFSDINGNGKKDSNDTGLKGWVVYVDLNGDGKFETNENNKTTDSSGNFTFVSLHAGTYKVRVIPVGGYSQTAPISGYYTVTLSPGVPVSVSFAEHPTNAKTATGGTGVTLSGTVFSDTNSDGSQDTTEAGLSNWVVYADLNNDGKFQPNENNKTTDANGSFSFVSLAPGTYTIRLIPQNGYTQTVPSSGFYTVTLSAGSDISVSFGEHKA